eukprot:1430-Heterococcus_DN1.PRE.3
MSKASNKQLVQRALVAERFRAFSIHVAVWSSTYFTHLVSKRVHLVLSGAAVEGRTTTLFADAKVSNLFCLPRLVCMLICCSAAEGQKTHTIGAAH